MNRILHIPMLNLGQLNIESNNNLAKLDYGLAESPTVMVVDKTKNRKCLAKNRGILKPSWAFVETTTVIVVDKTKNRTFLAKMGAYLNPVGLSLRPITFLLGYVTRFIAE
jgi:hypothetical protein